MPGRMLLLVEDEDVIRENYAEMLCESGFEVLACGSAKEALLACERAMPDLALLDITLGHDRDAGFHLCTDLRRLSESVPIVFLTSHDDEVDKISGLRLGADDYITKDSSMTYIVVRLTTLLRRREILGRPTVLESSHGIELDRGNSRAYWNGKKLVLPLTQYWILEQLVSNAGIVQSHKDLMKAASMTVEPNTVVAHVKAIRDAIRALDSGFECIKTERGRGYRWVSED